MSYKKLVNESDYTEQEKQTMRLKTYNEREEEEKEKEKQKEKEWMKKRGRRLETTRETERKRTTRERGIETTK